MKEYIVPADPICAAIQEKILPTPTQWNKELADLRHIPKYDHGQSGVCG